MRTVLLLLLACAWSLVAASASPQYGNRRRHKNGKKDCRVVSDVEYRTEYDTVCDTEYESVCQTRYEEKCVPYQHQECRAYSRRQCDTKYERKCQTRYRTEYRTRYEEYVDRVPVDDYVEACEKEWVEDGYGGKRFVENPNRCKKVLKTGYKEVHKKRPVREPYREPIEDCKDVPRRDCYDVPEKKCEYVTKQRCNKVPYQDCRDVPREACRQVHKRVPHQVQKTVCAGDGRRHSDRGDDEYSYDDYDYGSDGDVRSSVGGGSVVF